MRVRNHTNPFQCLQRYGTIDWANVFGQSVQSMDLEIGVGRGVFIRNYAKRHPDRKIIGIEVRKILADTLNDLIQEPEFSNIRMYYGNGVTFLEESIVERILDRVFVFHPDPWPKLSHHKRRVIQPAFLEMIHKKMRPGARLYFSTDNEILWNDTNPLFLNSPYFEIVEDDPFWKEDYTSHWHQFSVRDGRNVQFLTVERKEL